MCEMRTSDKSVRPTLSLSLLGGDIYKIYQLWNRGLMKAGLREFPSRNQLPYVEKLEGVAKSRHFAGISCVRVSTCFSSAGSENATRERESHPRNR